MKHWHDKQVKDDAKIAKRLTAVRQALQRLFDSTDSEKMERDDLHELVATAKKIETIFGKYSKQI